jgi:redox-sensitive bicupin YhaK (pirin superfamily)
VSVSPGARVSLPWAPGFNALAYSLAGNGYAGAERALLPEGQMALFGDGEAYSLTADLVQDSRGTGNWEVLVLGGQPINEPVARYGPFVMNTRQEILQAVEDYQAGRLGTIPAQWLPHQTTADDKP